MCTQSNTSIGTEPVLHYPIHNQAMPGYVGATCLFYLEGRKVSFRCCPSQNFNSDNPPFFYRIQACFSDTFDPERIMGAAVGVDRFKPTTRDGNPVPITRIQMPSQLAERIQAIATAELAIVEKYKEVQAEKADAGEKILEMLRNTSPEEMPNPDDIDAAAKHEAFFANLVKNTVSPELEKQLDAKREEEKQLDLVKLEVGTEFEKFSSSQGISLLHIH